MPRVRPAAKPLDAEAAVVEEPVPPRRPLDLHRVCPITKRPTA